MTNVPTKAFRQALLDVGRSELELRLGQKVEVQCARTAPRHREITIPRIKTASAAASQATNSITR